MSEQAWLTVLQIVLGAVILFCTWVFNRISYLTNELTRQSTAFKCYLAWVAKDGAQVLEAATNPTPADMAELLRKYRDDEKNLTFVERTTLMRWLQSLIEKPDVAKGERAIAITILSSMRALDVLEAGKPSRWKAFFSRSPL